MSDKFPRTPATTKRKPILYKTPASLKIDATPSKRLKKMPVRNLKSDYSSDENSIELSIESEFDELIRLYKNIFTDNLLTNFIEFAEHQELCRLEWLKSVNECKRLQSELEKANHEIGDFSLKLKNARRLLDAEKKRRRFVEEERDTLQHQMLLARNLLFNEKEISENTKEKLSFLNSTPFNNRPSINGITNLNTITEVNSNELNSTGSLLSDFSYSRSEDNLDTSVTTKLVSENWKRTCQSPVKKRKSGDLKVEINSHDKIVAKTTVSAAPGEAITVTSTIDVVPQEQTAISSPVSTPVEKKILKPLKSAESETTPVDRRQHAFVARAVLCPDVCGFCKERVRFGTIAFKCKECRGICHMECKASLPLPCIPTINTPGKKGLTGTIADYVPSTKPFVPSILVHCLNEIELKGLKEVGLYRIPGSEKEVKLLKDNLLRSKNLPSLSNVDVHVLCGVVKTFLRSLKEPLITKKLRNDFLQIIELEPRNRLPTLYKVLAQLPPPNRDSLSYLMMHLNRVAQSKDCKMPIENIAKIFAPTIIGYSSDDIHISELLLEVNRLVAVIHLLMDIPFDYWASNINKSEPANSKLNLLKTPSTDSLSKAKFFSPRNSKACLSARKRKKFFATPPPKKPNN